MFIHSACVDYFEMEVFQFGGKFEGSKSRKASSAGIVVPPGYQSISPRAKKNRQKSPRSNLSPKQRQISAHPKST
jgi:hypothetical protein